ncbi:MAG: indolepyruvate oxidoreductase subunit beta [Clostridia bacterium]|nr:indolepyruvate oxidoreductase subunit beta [Clostridia bacterium]
MTKNILLVGVGGQGTILASKILTLGLQKANYDVKMSEIHGMSQRGGSVTSHIKYSEDQVYSPVIEQGQADIIVAFEKMEALRYLDYLKKDGKIFVNDYEIPSIPITSGQVEYPQGILEELKRVADTTVIDATKEAEKIGSSKVMNMILLGTIIGSMNLTHIDWDTILTENVKPQFIELNKAAIRQGIALAK